MMRRSMASAYAGEIEAAKAFNAPVDVELARNFIRSF
jgi:hypothetical protein